MPLTLRYDLTGMGWGLAHLGNGETEIACSIEWEVDTLAEILREACYQLERHKERTHRELTQRPFGNGDPPYAARSIEFFTWPSGRHILEFDQKPATSLGTPPTDTPPETPLTGWLVWRPTFKDEGEEELIFVWATTVGEFAALADAVATDLLTRYGFRGYADRWHEFDFPLALYARLRMLRGEKTLTIALD